MYGVVCDTNCVKSWVTSNWSSMERSHRVVRLFVQKIAKTEWNRRSMSVPLLLQAKDIAWLPHVEACVIMLSAMERLDDSNPPSIRLPCWGRIAKRKLSKIEP